ncbi:unnamed protein product [Paramecium primaurelia]|uniref:Uncharacterized protein n=1 Tax=Paramecium primaurelia TaxID=5886 RepID=A0A8S1PSF2_PARPR|nr:unnamed protein product [Paramecium primaurelia]
MTSYMQSSFSIQTKANFDFLQQPSDSDSDDESKQMLKGTQQQNQQRDIKKQKKLIDIESLKSELGIRPIIENVNPENYYRRYSRKSIGTLTNMIIPTSSILIEQLSQIKKIKEIKKEVPPELLGRIYSEFRYKIEFSQILISSLIESSLQIGRSKQTILYNIRRESSSDETKREDGWIQQIGLQRELSIKTCQKD